MKKRGFTLIELLVVVSIIALLIAILLPGLSRARTQAKKTVTLAHLRGIGIAVATYEQDNRDKHPALLNREEKAILGLSLLGLQQKFEPKLLINPNTEDVPASTKSEDGRLILADLAGAEITDETAVDPGNVAQVNFHCSFSYDNDVKAKVGTRTIVYLGDRADYENGKTFSRNWKDQGMCLLWTDQHAEFYRKKSLADQGDPNIYHHNEFGGEGADEVVDGVKVTDFTLDTHLRFFSEAEDDALLPN